MSILSRWRELLVRARTNRHGLDYLFHSAATGRTLAERLEWLQEVLAWLRTSPRLASKSPLDFTSGHGQAARFRLLMQALGRNPEYQRQVAKTCRSILRDIDGLEFFRSTGLPGAHGLWSEAMSRFTEKLIPSHLDGKDLGEAFEVLFPDAKDVAWLSRIDADGIQSVAALLNFEVAPGEDDWNTTKRDMAEALFLLASEAQTIGLGPMLRRRRANPHQSAFLSLENATGEFLSATHSGKTVPPERIERYLAVVDSCKAELGVFKTTLASEGVSLTLVYSIARLEAILERMTSLTGILAGAQTLTSVFVPFLIRLIDENRRGKSLRYLWRENAAILSRRITDRNADTGHHYITRSRTEYSQMVKAACGGGILTSLTVIAKLGATALPVSYLMKGLLVSLNYSVSFLAIQFLGFTLATKQPAMTAAAIASHISNLDDDREVAKLVHEIIHLVRSQMAAIAGNVLAVVPGSVALFFALQALLHEAPLAAPGGLEILNETSVFGWSLFFAAFTGILLWLSSLAAGWSDNWVALHKLPQAIRGNRRLRFLFGSRGVERLASFTHRRAADIGGNVSLGFLLGLVPKIFAFAGIHLDARHVTLTAGTVAFCAAAVGGGVWREHALWQAVACIPLIGVCNVGVSFGIALSIAIKARNVSPSNKRRLYRALVSRMARKPLQVLLPIGL